MRGIFLLLLGVILCGCAGTSDKVIVVEQKRPEARPANMIYLQ